MLLYRGCVFPNLLLLQDNAGVIVNNKGDMKGSVIVGPVAKECVCMDIFEVDPIPHPFPTGRSLAPYRSKSWYSRMNVAW